MVFCTSGQCLIKAGLNVSPQWASGAYLRTIDATPIATLISGAESTINTMCRYNFTDNYATLNGDTKEILQDVCSDMVAINLVKYDMSNYTSRIEAEDIINVLRDSKLMGLSILRDKKAQDFINAA